MEEFLDVCEEVCEETPKVEVEAETETEVETEAEAEAEPNVELERLKAEISTLKEELKLLEDMKKHSERVLEEVNEFTSLFPEKNIDTLPDEVWEQVRRGSSLAASFALYEKKCAHMEELARGINQKNASLSAGLAGVDTPCEYFTQEQVRAMSRAEVRQNYEKIRESMKRWN